MAPVGLLGWRQRVRGLPCAPPKALVSRKGARTNLALLLPVLHRSFRQFLCVASDCPSLVARRARPLPRWLALFQHGTGAPTGTLPIPPRHRRPGRPWSASYRAGPRLVEENNESCCLPVPARRSTGLCGMSKSVSGCATARAGRTHSSSWSPQSRGQVLSRGSCTLR
jgi:hypothetical protein